MSAKQRKMDDGAEGSSSDSSDSDSEDVDSELQQFVDQNVVVDFEGRTPTETDFHGIRQLLLPVLPRAHVNWGDMVDLIISQNYVGSVLKQCEDEGPDGDASDGEDPMDVDADKEVYGITTVVNLTSRKERESVKDLVKVVLGRCKSSGAPPHVQERFQAALTSQSEHCGWLVNERFVNIPLQICAPLLTSLRDEMEEAVQKSMPYKFSNYLLISKLHRAERAEKKSKKKSSSAEKSEPAAPELTWLNGEDEIFNKMCECSFEFSVAAETDMAVDGAWSDRDTRQTPLRRIMLIAADKLSPAIDQICRAVQALPS